jgi:hypothetical protein
MRRGRGGAGAYLVKLQVHTEGLTMYCTYNKSSSGKASSGSTSPKIQIFCLLKLDPLSDFFYVQELRVNLGKC